MTAYRMPIKRKMFYHEYLIDFNGAKACIRAGYYFKNARHQASRLLTKANTQAKIKELMEARSIKVDLTADMILTELKNII